MIIYTNFDDGDDNILTYNASEDEVIYIENSDGDIMSISESDGNFIINPPSGRQKKYKLKDPE